MSMHGDGPPRVSYDVNAETAKISDLLSMLKSTFRKNYFKKVEGILTAREERLKGEVNHWRKEYESMEKAHGEGVLNKLEMEDEMNQYKHECKSLTGQITRLIKEKETYHKKEKVIIDEKKFYEGEKKAQIMYENLLKEFKKLEKENKELTIKNSELDSKKIKSQRVLKRYKENIKEYDLRLAQLEKDVEKVRSKRAENPVSANKVGEEKTSTNVTPTNEALIGNGCGDLTEAKMEKSGSYQVKVADSVIVPCKEGKTISNETILGIDSSHRRKNVLTTDAGYKEAVSGPFIEISDSDDEKHVSNQTPREETAVIRNTEVKKMSKSIEADDENQSISSTIKRKRESCFDVGVNENESNKRVAVDWSIFSSSSDSGRDHDEAGGDSDSDVDSDIIRRMLKDQRRAS